MVKLGLLARMEAKPGKEAEVDAFLRGALPIVQAELGTIAWFAIRIGTSSFGIFDVFADDAGRQAHLNGRVAAALMTKAPGLFTGAPTIQKLDVLESKLPG
jgi:quinol monooxygenase YgiN